MSDFEITCKLLLYNFFKPYNKQLSDKIIDYTRDFCIFRCDKYNLYRSIMVNIPGNMLLNYAKSVELMVNIDLRNKDQYYLYSVYEINLLGNYLPDIVIEYKNGKKISFERFNLAIHSEEDKFRIINAKSSENTQYDFDEISGVDILILLVGKIFGVKLSKISEVEKNSLLKSNKTREIYLV